MVLGFVVTPLWMLLFPVWLVAAIILYPIREALLSSPFVDVSAEATPKGTWAVHHYVPTPEAFKGLGLAHSAAYNDSRVLGRIVEWIANGWAYSADEIASHDFH
jgi:hypothetical protein